MRLPTKVKSLGEAATVVDPSGRTNTAPATFDIGSWRQPRSTMVTAKQPMPRPGPLALRESVDRLPSRAAHRLRPPPLSSMIRLACQQAARAGRSARS